MEAKPIRLKYLFESPVAGLWGEDPTGDNDGDVPCVRVADFDRERFVVKPELTTRRAVPVAAQRSRLLQSGDVLVEKSGNVGFPALFEGAERAISSNFLVRLRPLSGVNSRFAWYLLQALWSKGEGRRFGNETTLANLDLRRYLSTWVALPSLSDQERIVRHLDDEVSSIDAFVAVRRRHLALLDERRFATVDQVFLDSDAERRPVKWTVACVQVGIVVQPAQYYQPTGWPLLRGINVKPGHVSRDDMRYIGTEDNVLQRKSRLQKGDIVVVRTGKAGAAAVVPDWADGANCVDLLIVRTGDALIPRYLEYFLNSQEARRQVAKHSVGAIQAHFNVEAMKRVLIPVPSLEAQQQAVEYLDDELRRQDAFRDAVNRQLSLMAERRRSVVASRVLPARQTSEHQVAA